MTAFLTRVAALLSCAVLVAFAAPPHAPLKVLHTAFLVAETNFDPAATSDLYSNSIIEEILEPPLTYDWLARPAKLKPLTAEALPEITDGGRTYTLRIRKGIYFADDPAFNGRRRELTAKDYEFAFKRLIDPKLRSPNLWLIEGIEGVKAAEEKANRAGRLDYDAPIPGIEVLDRYTLRFHLVKPDYTFIYLLALETVGAQAREVAERYGDEIGAHPVGTGPFVLAEWKRSSKIVLARNPGFREEYYDAEPPADDPLSQQLYAEMKGKRLPCVDRVEVSIIEESQPRWLAFLNGEIDWINLPYEFQSMGLPKGELAPWLAKRGVRYMPDLDPSVTYLYFNMKDPMLGGYTPDKVALRRAISLAYDTQEEISLIRSGTAIEAQMLPSPGVIGYDPDFNLGVTYDPARAKALLDMYGYVDRDGDGWRDMPDGSPLVFRYAATPTQLDRQFTELWKKDMDAVGIRMQADVEKWPDLRKKSKAGLLQDWALGWVADYPDAMDFYQLLYGPNCGISNDGCFQLPEFDALYEEASRMKPGPERAEVLRKMDRLVAAYAPVKLGTYRKRDELVQPWILGWRKHPILHEGYKYVDIDLARRAAGVR
ncbi:MAG TPA: ABC transporter substrate-binding protein [Usitatibacter sp.]|nr:ABC transporter substrate-binding protein [Usitatibacter sp.]